MKVDRTVTSVSPAPASQAGGASSSGRTSRESLRGLDYDAQVQALTPPDGSVQLKAKDDSKVDGAATETVEPKDDKEGGGHLGFGKRAKRLEEILDPSNAPLAQDAIAEAEAIIAELGKKKAESWQLRLQARVKSGDAETRLAEVLEHLDAPISAAATAEARGLVEGLLDNRRAQWSEKLEHAIAWGAAESELAALVEDPDSALSEDDIAAAEALLIKLPEERRPEWDSKLKLRVENDPTEEKLRAALQNTSVRITDAQAAELKGLIGTLTNGRQAQWEKALSDRLMTDAAAVFDADEATRTEALSTMSADDVHSRAKDKKTRRGKQKSDEKTRVEFGDAEIKVSEIKDLKKGDYAANVEAMVGAHSDQLNLSQKALIEKAKEFIAKGPQPAGARAAFGELNVPSHMAASPDLTLDGELITRMKRFTKFAAWAGLLGAAPTVNGGVRSPAAAHDMSVRYMFTSGIGLGGAGNRKVVADWAVANNGTAPDKQWIPDDLVAKLEAAGGDDKVHQQVLLTDMKSRVTAQEDQAAEGYPDGDSRRMPNMRPTGVSLHCSGQAIDVSYAWVFSNSYDPMIDLLAAYFGLWRPVKDSQSSPEYWHFEKIGSVVESNATAD